MKLLNELVLLTEEKLIEIKPKDIEIENGKMLPNQFPNKVDNFNCSNLKNLTSLENCPQEVEKDFDCYGSSITSLEHGPTKVDNCFYDCHNTKITSLDYSPLICDQFWCQRNDIKHLKGIGRFYLKECKKIYLPDSIKSNVLGLCKIKNLNSINVYSDKGESILTGKLYNAIEIVKKYLGTDGEECAEELRQNGFNDYAKF